MSRTCACPSGFELEKRVREKAWAYYTSLIAPLVIEGHVSSQDSERSYIC